MGIKKIEEDLKKRESKYSTRKHDETPYNEWRAEKIYDPGQHSFWGRFKDRLVDTRTRAVMIGALVVAGLVIIAAAIMGVILFQRSFFMQEHVLFSASAPKNAESNRTVEIIFSYNNDNRATLQDSEIAVTFGQYFIPEEQQENFTRTGEHTGVIALGEVAAKEQGSATLVGHFVAPQNEVENIEATMHYTPERISTVYTRDAHVGITVTSSPIKIDITTEKEAVSGNVAEVVFTYRNTSNVAIENMRLQVVYPQQFVVQEAEPTALTGNDVWAVEHIEPRGSGTVRVRGVMSGRVNDVAQFETRMVSRDSDGLTYATTAYPVRIIASPIMITQTWVGGDNNIVYPGEHMEYTVTIQNNGDVPLHNAVATMSLDGRVIDVENLDTQDKGFYDPTKRLITWKAADVPGLAVLNPGDTVEMNARIPILGRLPVRTADDKDFTVTTIVALDSNDLPSAVRENKNASSNAKVLLLGAKPLLSRTLTHVSGPLPPKVGQETRYHIALGAGVVNNDLKDVVVQGALPTGITFVGEEEQTDENFQINERTNSFTWNIGTLDHGTGILTPERTIEFDAVFTPSVNQVATNPVVMQDLVIDATDLFTKESLRVNGDILWMQDVETENSKDKGGVEPADDTKEESSDAGNEDDTTNSTDTQDAGTL